MSKCAYLPKQLVAIGAFTAILVALLLSSVSAQPAWADQIGWGNPKELHKAVKAEMKSADLTDPESGQKYDHAFLIKNKITKVKSSNSKVLKAKARKSREFKGYWELILTPKKAGKSTLKYTIKGKTYKVKCVVVKYKNALAKLKIGNVDLTKKFKKRTTANITSMPVGKLAVKAAKGWKIAEITGSLEDFSDYKLGNSFTVREGTNEIMICMKNKKTKKVREIYLSAA